MTWAGPAEFFAMGGYGLYVWGSFAVAALAIAAELVLLHQRHRTAEQRVGLSIRSVRG